MHAIARATHRLDVHDTDRLSGLPHGLLRQRRNEYSNRQGRWLANWRSGKNYLRDFVRPYNLWWQLLVLGVGAYLPLALSLRGRREYRCALVVAAFVVAGLLNAYYVTRVGGDWLHARLLLPAFFALCAPVAVVPITKRYLVSVALAIWVLVVGTGFRPPPHQRHPARRLWWSPTST